MLTLKLITEETDRVIRGLEKKHFDGAKEAIEKVIAIDKARREAQQKSDRTKQEAKQMAARIGDLMKQGKKDEADDRSFNQTCNTLSEFGTRLKGGPASEAYYAEHYETIVRQNALGALSKL